jgi:hypothetical protein
VFSTQSAKDPLEKMADGDLEFSGNSEQTLTVQEGQLQRQEQSVTGTVTVQFSGNNSSEEPGTETVTATATCENQKTSHWFVL